MEKYKKPSVVKGGVELREFMQKKANCSGDNARKMPVGSFESTKEESRK